MIASDGKAASDPALDEEISKTLVHHQWYHGMMPRDEIEDLLKKDGDFLVQRTDVANKPRYSVSVHNKTRIQHILINHTDGLWEIRGAKKNTIIELIEHIVETKHPVQLDGTTLVTPVPFGQPPPAEEATDVPTRTLRTRPTKIQYRDMIDVCHQKKPLTLERQRRAKKAEKTKYAKTNSTKNVSKSDGGGEIQKTVIGLKAKAKMDKGGLIPVEVVLDLVKIAMLEDDSKGASIDGYPREVKQGDQFEDQTDACSKETLDRGKPSGGSNTNIDTIKLRLDTFFNSTRPVVDHYTKKQKLVKVEDVPAIFANVCAQLDKHVKK